MSTSTYYVRFGFFFLFPSELYCDLKLKTF